MRDYTGIPYDLERNPILRKSLFNIDYFLKDLNRGIQRIQVGQIPDGSGETIIDQVISKKYWYKPGDASFGTAFMETASGGSGIISSTSHSTKGFVNLGASGGLAYDETNVRIGLAQTAPTARLHMVVAAGPSFTAPSAAAQLSGSWAASSGTLVDCLNDRDTDPTGADWVRWTASLGNFTGSITFPVMADPGAGVLFGFRILLRASAGCQTRLLFSFGFGSTTVTTGIVWGGESNTDTTATNYRGNVATTFSGNGTGDQLTNGEYYFVMSTADSATMRTGVAAGGAPFLAVANQGNVGTETFDTGYVALTVESGSATTTLQKWATDGSVLNQLDFSTDGASSSDMVLSGNAELMVTVGDATSGLRTYNASNTQWLEVGKNDQTNMNLTLAGNRQATGTLLTSNFTTSRLNGVVGISQTPNSAVMLHVLSTAAGNQTFRGVAHASQSGDLWQLRNNADNANLASFDSTGKLIATTGLRNPHNTELPASSQTLASSPTAFDLGNTSFLRLNATGVRLLRGIGGGTDGRFCVLVDPGTTSYTIKDEDTGASAANRIITPNGEDIATAQKSAYFLIYDSTTQRWRLFNWVAHHVNEIITGSWTFSAATTTFDINAGGAVIIAGAASSNAPILKFNDADTSFNIQIVANSIYTGDAQLILPDAGTDTFVFNAFAATLSNKTLAASCVGIVSTASSGFALQDTTTSTKKLRHVLSGAVGSNSFTWSGTAARDLMFDADISARLVVSGNDAVAAAGGGTAGLLGKHDSTGNTGSIAATTIGNTLPAGMYRVSWYVKVTTAGDAEPTDSLLVTVAWNDGGAQSRTAIPQNETVAAAIDGTMPVNNLNRAFSGDFVIYSAAGQNVTVATTLVNAGATNPDYTFRARIEAI